MRYARLILLLALPTCGRAAGERADGEGAASLLDACIEMARADHPDLDADQVRTRIERLVARYADLCQGGDAAARTDAMRELLFDDRGFTSVESLDSIETLHVDSVLAARRGYCLSLSAIALIVAEAASVPFHGVAAPNHFFVRYDDGEDRENLEMTRRGAAFSESEARALLGEFDDDGGVYLRNLTREEVATIILHNRGYVAMIEKRRDAAERDLRAVIRRMPNLPEAHRNLGVLLGEQERWDEAIAACDEALRLFPGDVDAMLNRALCRHASGRFDAAIEDLKLVQAIAPGHPRARRLLDEFARPRDPESKREAPKVLEPGLLGRYYNDPRFRSLVLERVDREVDFDWQNGSPGGGVPRDRFSVQWSGYLKVDVEDLYTFFVVANDGARLELDGKVIAENWKDMGYENWYGTADAALSSGYHPIRIDYFDERGGARILLRVGREGAEKPIDLRSALFHVKDGAK